MGRRAHELRCCQWGRKDESTIVANGGAKRGLPGTLENISAAMQHMNPEEVDLAMHLFFTWTVLLPFEALPLLTGSSDGLDLREPVHARI